MRITLNLATRTCINRRAVYFGYGVAMILLATVLAYQVFGVLTLQGESRRVGTDLAAMKSAAGKVQKPQEISPERRRQLQEEVAFANDLIEKDGFRWTALLGRLEDVAVEGIALRSVQPDFKGRSLRLNGAARSVPQLQTYLDRLIASPDFSEVYLLDQATSAGKDERNGEWQGTSFSLAVKGGF